MACKQTEMAGDMTVSVGFPMRGEAVVVRIPKDQICSLVDRMVLAVVSHRITYTLSVAKVAEVLENSTHLSA